MEKIIVELDVKAGDAEKNIDNVSKSLKDLNKEATVANNKTKKGLKDTGEAAKKSEKSVGLLSKGFKAMGGALKAAGIGIVLSVITALFEVMHKNQKVLDALETATNFIAVAFKAVTEALTNAYDIITSSTDGFDAMGKVVDGLITLALTPLKLMFYQLKLAMQAVKVGYETMFGDEESVKKAKEALAETTKDIQQLALDAVQAGKDIANNIGEAIDEVGTATTVLVTELGKIDPKKLLETASAMTTLKNNAEIAAAVQAGLVEKYDRLAEKQRQIRDNETLSIKDRKKANDELLITLEKQEKAMLKEADAQIADAKAQVAALDNQENRIKLIDALNNKLGVQAQITGLISEQQTNANALDKEQIELTNSKAESESNLSIAKRKYAAEQILIEQSRLEKLIEINEAEKEIESTRLQAIVDNANAGTQAKIDAQIALDEFVNTNNEENATLKKDLGLQEVSDAKAVADAKKSIQMGNLSNVASGFALLSQLAGKNKALQAAALIGESAVGIAKTVINTQAANAAAVLKYALLPGGLALAKAESAMNNVSAGIGIATNIAATAKGLSSLGGGGSTPSSPSLSSVGGGGAPQPPAFNVVGASDTNQLAGAIGNQSQQPIQTYVVSGDVSTSQELDRNIVTGASI